MLHPPAPPRPSDRIRRQDWRRLRAAPGSLLPPGILQGTWLGQPRSIPTSTRARSSCSISGRPGCGPCTREMPGLRWTIQKKYAGERAGGHRRRGRRAGPLGAEGAARWSSATSPNTRSPIAIVLGDDKIQAAFGGIEAIPTTFHHRSGRHNPGQEGLFKPSAQCEHRVLKVLEAGRVNLQARRKPSGVTKPGRGRAGSAEPARMPLPPHPLRGRPPHRFRQAERPAGRAGPVGQGPGPTWMALAPRAACKAARSMPTSTGSMPTPAGFCSAPRRSPPSISSAACSRPSGWRRNTWRSPAGPAGRSAR